MLTLGASGCTMAVTQAVAVDAHGQDLRLREDARTRIQLLQGEIVDFAKVRVVGDTLYAWRSSTDSIAIPIRDVLSVEQQHFDAWRTGRNIVLGAAAVVVLAFGTLVLLLSTEGT
jgi:hypothetical protein